LAIPKFKTTTKRFILSVLGFLISIENGQIIFCVKLHRVIHGKDCRGLVTKTMIDCRAGTVPGRQRDVFCPLSKMGYQGIGEPDSRVGPPTRGFYTRSRNFAIIMLSLLYYAILFPPSGFVGMGMPKRFENLTI
jgi:hypothetical protein